MTEKKKRTANKHLAQLRVKWLSAVLLLGICVG